MNLILKSFTSWKWKYILNKPQINQNNIWKIFEGELFIKTLSTTFLQIFRECILHFKSSFKNTTGPDNICLVDFIAWVTILTSGSWWVVTVRRQVIKATVSTVECLDCCWFHGATIFQCWVIWLHLKQEMNWNKTMYVAGVSNCLLVAV